MSARTLMVVSARAGDASRAAVASRISPRKDYLELAYAMGADVIDYETIERSRGLRLIRKIIGTAATQVCVAFTRRSGYDCIYTDGEHVGIRLALLLRWCRRRPRHVTLGHLLTTRTKQLIFRLLRPQAGLDCVLVHATLQAGLARDRLRLDPEQIALVPYQADAAFWKAPRSPVVEDLVCSAGLEYRDYGTLLAAVAELGCRVVIAAGSHWSKHRGPTHDISVPANVQVTALDYIELRGLYARARVVVVPLHEVDNQAGVTTILEAMAMSKPIIVTATRGQSDVVRGRIWTAEGPEGEPHGGPDGFGIRADYAPEETGIYVRPGDVEALRRAIEFLLEHPQDAERLGAAGRRLVERSMSLEHFVRRVCSHIELGYAAGDRGPGLPHGCACARHRSGRRVGNA